MGSPSTSEQSAPAGGKSASLIVIDPSGNRTTVPLHALPFDDNAFDVIVVHGLSGLLSSLDASARIAALRESARVLRQGGRIVIIESGPRAGIGGLVRPQRTDKAYDESGGAAGALAAAGFRASRVLAEREGYRFSEGMKG